MKVQLVTFKYNNFETVIFLYIYFEINRELDSTIPTPYI